MSQEQTMSISERKVSVIMGVYNCADTLRESIDTVVHQTFTDWEFVICDDGSSDGTVGIVEEYAKKYPEQFIILKNKSNMGLNATLNRCLRAAKGKYIARQDGDDVSVPERFQKEVDFLDAHPEFAFVSSNMDYFDDNGIWGQWVNPTEPTRLDFLKHSPCFCHAPCMVRREAFVKVGGYTEKERYLRCEDINLWYKLYAEGYKGYNIQEPLYRMRDDKNAYKRRTLKNRMNIILTEWDGMRSLNCNGTEYLFFVKKAFKHVVLVFLPESIYKALHRKKLNAEGRLN